MSNFFQDFIFDRLAPGELYDVLGGVERNDDLDDITVEDFTYRDAVYDHILPDWQNSAGNNL